MKPEQLPKVDNEEYNPSLDAQDEEVASGGSNRLTYILVGLVVALVIGYVALPKGGGTGVSSVTPAFMLDDAPGKANATTTDSVASSAADNVAADFNAAPTSTSIPTSAAGSESGVFSESESTVANASASAPFGKETTSPEESDKPAASRPAANGRSTRTSASVSALAPVTASSTGADSEPSSGSVEAPTTVAPLAPAAPAAPSASVVMSGHISDENGRPLVGATVLLKGSTKGTSTDASGNYSIEVPNSTDNALIFGYAGYEDEIVRGTGAKFANVILTPNVKASKKPKE